jgi:hypothetical protein
MSFIEGEITVQFGGAVGPAGPAGNAVPIAANTVLANKTGDVANPTGTSIAELRTLLEIPAIVETASGLASATGLTTGQLVDLRGYLAEGDGGGQTLIYYSTGRAAKVSEFTTNGRTFIDNGFRFAGGGDSYFEAVNTTQVIATRFGVFPTPPGATEINCAPRFNAMLETCRSQFDANVMRGNYTVHLPPGIFIIGSKLIVKSGVGIIGSNAGTRIQKATSWTGDQYAFDFQGMTSGYCMLCTVKGLTISGGGAFRAFNLGISSVDAVNSLTFLQNEISEIILDCYEGLIGGNYTYSQSNKFSNWMSVGTIKTMIAATGNQNLIEYFDKEGTTSADEGPYIQWSGWTLKIGGTDYSGPSSGLRIVQCIIEGGGSALKHGISLTSCEQVHIEGIHIEYTACNGYWMKLLNCRNIFIYGYIFHGGTVVSSVYRTNKLSIVNTPGVNYDIFDGSDTVDLFDDVEIDADSSLKINKYITSTGSSVRYAGTNVEIDTVINRQMASAGYLGDGFSDTSIVHYAGANLLRNPSFEAGASSWSFDHSGDSSVVTYPDSTVASGKMMTVTRTANGVSYIYQGVSFFAGVPMTLTALVKCTSGSASAYVAPFISGGGLDGAALPYNTAAVGKGWQLLSTTFTPVSSAAGNVGFRSAAGLAFSLDAVCCTIGKHGQLDQTDFQSMQLSGKYVDFGAAAPTTGTFVVGSIRINSSPTVNGVLCWVCTTAGTPGTWTPIYSGVATDGALVVGRLQVGALNHIDFNGLGNNFLSGITYFRDGSGVAKGSFDGNTGSIATTASTTARAPLNLPHGTAPTAPVDGDIWTTSAGLYVRINGATVGPLS